MKKLIKPSDICNCTCHTEDVFKHMSACCYECPTCHERIRTYCFDSHINKHRKEFSESEEELFKKTSFATGKIFTVNDLENEKFWIHPSDIIADSTDIRYDTFASSFGSFENEAVAYQICKFFMEYGDLWFPVKIETLNEYVLKTHSEFNNYAKAFANREDYAELIDDKIVFTNLFIERCAGFRSLNELERWKVKNVFELAVTM